MQISEDTYQPTDTVIEKFNGSVITINKQEYQSSLIVSAKKVISPWPIKNLNELCTEHLTPIIELQPDLVLIGTGTQGRLAKKQQLIPLYEAKIAVESMSNAAACRTYNALLSEGRHVVAAIILEEQ